MRKTTIVKLFVGSLIGLAVAAVMLVVAAVQAASSNALIMQGPDVVGVRPEAFTGTLVGVALIALLVAAVAAVVQFVSWIGAMLNTVQLEDKTWFILLLVLGLVSLAFPAMLAYAIAGPDGAAPRSAGLDQVAHHDERVPAPVP